MGITRQEDEFTSEKCKWIAKLSNGEVVYQDDNRPGENPPSAWSRLKLYVEENNLSILSIDARFYSHIEEIIKFPEDCDGYYFVQKAEAFAFSNESRSLFLSYVFGKVEGDVISTVQWLVPEIHKIGADSKKTSEVSQELIIKNNGKTKN